MKRRLSHKHVCAESGYEKNPTRDIDNLTFVARQILQATITMKEEDRPIEEIDRQHIVSYCARYYDDHYNMYFGIDDIFQDITRRISCDDRFSKYVTKLKTPLIKLMNSAIGDKIEGEMTTQTFAKKPYTDTPRQHYYLFE